MSNINKTNAKQFPSTTVTNRTVFDVVNDLKHHLMTFGFPLVFVNIPAQQMAAA